MTKEDLTNYMLELAKKRPVFHSEDDFKFELGYLLRQKCGNVRMERPFYLKNGTKVELDIEVNGEIAIELKYKKSALRKEINNEIFDLKDDKKFTYSRYDFVKDAWRVRSLIDENQHHIGFTIVLVNAKEYWSSVKERNKDKKFELVDSRKFSKGESLSLNNSKKANSYPSIKVNFSDEIKWNDYSDFNDENGTFKFFIIDLNQ